MDTDTARSPTRADRGMVVSPHAAASEVGAAALRDGGSAVDAALATAAALAVVYPHMTGVGGDAFWLIYDPTDGGPETRAEARVRCLDGGGRAPRAATLERFAALGLDAIPTRGPIAATTTVPGAVSSWGAAHDAYGRLPWARCFEAAIAFARDGFPATGRLAGWIARTADELGAQDETRAAFLPNGEPPQAGARLSNPALARTLQRIASEGVDGFYRGETAAALAAFSAASGGLFDAGDLAAAARGASWRTPLIGRHRDVDIVQTPPPTQGVTLLQILKLLEAYDLGAGERLRPETLHLMIAAKQIAYADRDRSIADPRFVEAPVEQVLSDAYAKERRRLIDPERALPWDAVPSSGSLTGDTVYIAAADADGRVVSLIHSIYWAFGAAVIAGESGVLLQNRGAYFSLDPAHPNRLEPGKTPLHTLIATLAFRDGAVWGALGCMGADGQPQVQLQVLNAMIDHGLDIQAAVDAPRWLSGRFALGEARDLLHVEGRIPREVRDALARRGHEISVWPDWSELAGHAHGIFRDRESGVWLGGADPRSDGSAVGV